MPFSCSRLLEGDETVRSKVAIKLAGLLVPNAKQVELIGEQPNLLFEATAINVENGGKYYVWICLEEKQVNMRRVFDTHVNSKKQYGCSHCIMASLSNFERDTKSYIEGRAIYLVGN